MGLLTAAAAALLGIKKRWLLRDSSGNEVILNVTTDSLRSWQSEATDHAVEKEVGQTSISDHVIDVPQEVNLTAILTNDVLTFADLGKDIGTIDKRRDQLLLWRENREQLEVSGDDEISSLLLTSISESINQDIGEGAAYDITLKQIKILGEPTQAQAIGLTATNQETVTALPSLPGA